MIETEKFPPQVKEAFDVLNSRGYESYAVGGCVRDALMGTVPHDFDITTNALPDEILSVFSSYHTLTHGVKHGTVTVMIKKMPIEITTYRVDGEYMDNRHPAAVEFTPNLADDLSRRDFTVNALACNAGGEVTDLFGGIEDIKRGVIRAVGDPVKRFEEDALRILRALRFASKLGFEIEPETAEAARKCRHLLDNISGERIRSELEGIVCGENVGKVLLGHSDIICAVIPEMKPCIGFLQNNPNHIYDVYTHIAVATDKCVNLPILRMAALFHDIGKPHCYKEDKFGIGHFKGHGAASERLCREITRRLRFDRKTRETLLLLVREHDNYVKPERMAVKRRLIELGEENFRLLLELQRADNKAKAPKAYADDGAYLDKVSAFIDDFVQRRVPLKVTDLALGGSDMIKLGFVEREIGAALAKLFDAVTDEKIPNEKYALMKYAKAFKNER